MTEVSPAGTAPETEAASTAAVQRWNTADRPVEEQYSYWREVVCEAFTPLRPVALGGPDRWQGRGLAGRVSSHPFGAVNGAVVGSCEQTIHHGDREIARTEEEVVFVNLMLDGHCRVTQDGRTCSSPAGTFSLVDARRPFTLDYTRPWRTVSFRVPAAALPGVERRTAVHVSSSHGLGQVVSEALTTTWRAAAGLTPDQASAAGSAVAVLVAALISSGAGASPPEQVPRHVLRDSVDRYVTRELRGGDVSPAAVARHFGISVRKLHLLYADGPTTFGQRVMHLRVLACADDLAARCGRVTLTELAAEWGFSDLSHLNRAFRRHVGCRPLELVDVRRAGAADLVTSPR